MSLALTDQSNPVVSYLRYEKERVYRTHELNPQVRKIAVHPVNHFLFIACGQNYLRSYDASDKTVLELKNTVIPAKFERENDFVDIAFFPETSAFVVISATGNVFIIEDF